MAEFGYVSGAARGSTPGSINPRNSMAAGAGRARGRGGSSARPAMVPMSSGPVGRRPTGPMRTGVSRFSQPPPAAVMPTGAGTGLDPAAMAPVDIRYLDNPESMNMLFAPPPPIAPAAAAPSTPKRNNVFEKTVLEKLKMIIDRVDTTNHLLQKFVETAAETAQTEEEKDEAEEEADEEEEQEEKEKPAAKRGTAPPTLPKTFISKSSDETTTPPKEQA